MSGSDSKSVIEQIINSADDVYGYDTPDGVIPVREDEDGDRVAPIENVIDVVGDEWYDVLNGVEKDAAAISYFDDRVNDYYNDVNTESAIEHVVRIDADSEAIKTIDELRYRKVSQYGDSDWERNRDGDKAESEIEYNHIAGYLPEYVLQIIGNRNDWDLKQIQEIRDRTNTNQADMVADGNVVDVKTVREGSGSNHVWCKWNSNEYYSKGEYQQDVRNKHADYGVHAYLQSIKQNGEPLTKEEIEDDDVEISIDELSEIWIGFELVVDYSSLKSDILQNDKHIFDSNQLCLTDDGVVFYHRNKIYKNGWYQNIKEFF